MPLKAYFRTREHFYSYLVEFIILRTYLAHLIGIFKDLAISNATENQNFST